MLGCAPTGDAQMQDADEMEVVVVEDDDESYGEDDEDEDDDDDDQDDDEEFQAASPADGDIVAPSTVGKLRVVQRIEEPDDPTCVYDFTRQPAYVRLVLKCAPEARTSADGLERAPHAACEVSAMLHVQPEIWPGRRFGEFTCQEHQQLALGVITYGNDWRRIQTLMVPSRAESEIAAYAGRWFAGRQPPPPLVPPPPPRQLGLPLVGTIAASGRAPPGSHSLSRAGALVGAPKRRGRPPGPGRGRGAGRGASRPTMPPASLPLGDPMQALQAARKALQAAQAVGSSAVNTLATAEAPQQPLQAPQQQQLSQLPPQPQPPQPPQPLEQQESSAAAGLSVWPAATSTPPKADASSIATSSDAPTPKRNFEWKATQSFADGPPKKRGRGRGRTGRGGRPGRV